MTGSRFGSFKSEKGDSVVYRRDPYEVLGVACNTTDQEIKSPFCRMALKSTKRFGPEVRRFDHLAFLNFAQNVVCFVWSFIMIKLWSSRTSSASRAPLWKYWGVSITNTIDPTMRIEALKYISYPS